LVFIYCWHEPNRAAIKVGMGADSSSRMREYAQTYDLRCDAQSLRVVKVRGFDARIIEQQIHTYLQGEGHMPLILNGVESELFDLNGHTYDRVAERVVNMAKNAMREVAKS
jgi:hypothetical protein